MSHDAPGVAPDPAVPDDGENPGESLFRSNVEIIQQAIRFVCWRHRLTPDEAENFSSQAVLKLMANGYAVLRKFRGASKLETFLVTTITRTLLDQRNAAWGKWRSSAEAVRLGPPAPLIEQLIVRDGYSFDEAFEILRTNCGMGITRAEFETILARLPPRTKRRFDAVDALEHLESGDSADKDVIDEEGRQASERLSGALEEELARLPTEDRLLIKLSDEDGLGMREIAGLLGAVPAALYRRRDRIRAELRKRLERRGFRPPKD